jgi:hypothetical protein
MKRIAEEARLAKGFRSVPSAGVASAGVPSAGMTSARVAAIAAARKPGWRRRDALDDEPQRRDDGWKCALHVSLRHPFYFDHPLDHVPGMQLVCGLLDLVNVVADADLDRPGGRLTASLTFASLCELRRTTLLSAAPGYRGRWAVRAEQYERPVCEGWVEHREGGRIPSGREKRRPDRSRPCPAELVHLARAENVMVGPAVNRGRHFTAAVLPPPPGHVLGGRHDGGYGVECLVEAGRQFTTMLLHRAAGHPLGTQLIWLGLDADLPCAVPGDLPLALRWRVEPLPGSTACLPFELIRTDAPAEPLGTAAYAVLAVSSDAYRRLRSTGASA